MGIFSAEITSSAAQFFRVSYCCCPNVRCTRRERRSRVIYRTYRAPGHGNRRLRRRRDRAIAEPPAATAVTAVDAVVSRCPPTHGDRPHAAVVTAAVSPSLPPPSWQQYRPRTFGRCSFSPWSTTPKVSAGIILYYWPILIVYFYLSI